jgi:hypothetical protein
VSSSGASVRSKKIRADFLIGRAEAVNSLKELLTYITEQPLSAVAALWIVCFPVLYFALYGDLVQSAKTMTEMTVIFVIFLMAFIVTLLSFSYLIALLLELRRRRRVRTISPWKRQ